MVMSNRFQTWTIVSVPFLFSPTATRGSRTHIGGVEDGPGVGPFTQLVEKEGSKPDVEEDLGDADTRGVPLHQHGVVEEQEDEEEENLEGLEVLGDAESREGIRRRPVVEARPLDRVHSEPCSFAVSQQRGSSIAMAAHARRGYLGAGGLGQVRTLPEHNIPVPDAGDDLLHDVLAQEALGVGDGGDLEGVERDEGPGRVLLVGVAVGVLGDGQAGDGLDELVPLAAAVAGDGVPRRPHRAGQGAREQRRGLVGGPRHAAVAAAPLLIAAAVGAGLVVVLVVVVGGVVLGDLVEAVVDDLALREVGEEAPGDDLGGVGARLVDALLLGGGAVVPLEGAAGGGWRWVVSNLCVRATTANRWLPSYSSSREKGHTIDHGRSGPLAFMHLMPCMSLDSMGLRVLYRTFLQDLQQGIHNGRVRTRLAQMLHEGLQALSSRCRPQLLKGDWKGDHLVEVARYIRCRRLAGGLGTGEASLTWTAS